MITASEARQIIRTYCFDYAETEPADITWWEQERAIEDLTLRLSWYVGKLLSATHVMDVLTTIDELDSLENGTHQDLNVNRAGTVNNSIELEDRINQQLDTEIAEVLTLAGWRPRVPLNYTPRAAA